MRKALWVLGTFFVLVLGCLLAAPRFVKWYVEEHYAGVQVSRAQIHWTGPEVVFFDVTVTRPGIDAHLKEVRAKGLDKTARVVSIHEGTLDLNLDKLPKSGASESKSDTNIVAYQLTMTVQKGLLRATLQGTNIDVSEVCFESGTVTHPKATLDIHNGCVARDKSQAHADSVSMPVTLPFKIPRVEDHQKLVLTKVEATKVDRLVKFESASLGPFKAHRGAVKLEDDGEVFLDIASVRVDHPWIAPHPVTLNQVSVTAPGSIIKSGKGALRIRLGAATIRVHPKEQWVEGEETCTTWFDALPKPLPDAMKGMAENFSGQLSFEVKTKPTPYLDIKQSCKYVCSESPIKELRGPFTYQVYNSKGKLMDRKAGPGTKDWVSFTSLPPHVPEAFRIMEDPGFLSHHGILVMALVNSLKANLKKGKFVKGGSTITMQLAKNLWLRRYKTIGRKAQEALMTLALESCLSKAQIIELYLNVVEFGPDLYGIGPATEHYFHKSPGALTADEAFYLASILPSPKKAIPPEAGGLIRARHIMKSLARSGFISDDIILDDREPLDTTGWDAY